MMITTKEMTANLIDALAAKIADDDALLDSLLDADFAPLADLLTERAAQRLIIALDFCPFHHCDIDTCNDDDLDCSDRINALLADII